MTVRTLLSENILTLIPFLMKHNSLLLSAMLSLALTSCTQVTVEDNMLSTYLQDVPFEMGDVFRPEFSKSSWNIAAFGGVGDGSFDNTQAFRDAMVAVSSQGGGHLVVPRGVWCTGPITFEDNVDLHLSEGAVILFSPDFDKYPIIDTYFEGLKTRRCQSPLNAKGKKNVAITGFGTIDGNGDAWRWIKRSKLTEGEWNKLSKIEGSVTGMAQGFELWAPNQSILENLQKCAMNVPEWCQTEEDWLSARDFLRPALLNFEQCENVWLQGVCFQNSPAWNLHPFQCQNVVVEDVMVINPWNSQNGDGLDLEACKNCLIVNTKFDVGDDAICVKSGKNKDGRDLQTPCENVVVDNCAVYHGHGGFVVGSEMSSGVKNVSVRNCMFLGTDVGLRFKSARGRGGVVENIHIDNINMINIPTDCILFDLHYTGLSASDALKQKQEREAERQRLIAAGLPVPEEEVPAVTEETPQFKDIYINNVTCQGAMRAFYFNGLPEMPVTNINISNAQVTADYGIEINESRDIQISNVQLHLPEGIEPFMSEHADNVTITDLTVNGKRITL